VSWAHDHVVVHMLINNSHPFDTIKVRLQTSNKTQFKGPLDCLLQTVRKEGVNGLYKVKASTLVLPGMSDRFSRVPPHL
jgi:hypothetical protein